MIPPVHLRSLFQGKLSAGQLFPLLVYLVDNDLIGKDDDRIIRGFALAFAVGVIGVGNMHCIGIAGATDDGAFIEHRLILHRNYAVVAGLHPVGSGNFLQVLKPDLIRKSAAEAFGDNRVISPIYQLAIDVYFYTVTLEGESRALGVVEGQRILAVGAIICR